MSRFDDIADIARSAFRAALLLAGGHARCLGCREGASEEGGVLCEPCRLAAMSDLSSVCPRCDARLRATGRFCRHCGGWGLGAWDPAPMPFASVRMPFEAIGPMAPIYRAIKETDSAPVARALCALLFADLRTRTLLSSADAVAFVPTPLCWVDQFGVRPAWSLAHALTQRAHKPLVRRKQDIEDLRVLLVDVDADERNALLATGRDLLRRGAWRVDVLVAFDTRA